MAPGTTITSEVYYETLNNLRRSIQKKRHWMLTKGVISAHDNARPPYRGSHKCFSEALQVGDFRPPSLHSGPGAKLLPSLHQDEDLVGYPALPPQRKSH